MHLLLDTIISDESLIQKRKLFYDRKTRIFKLDVKKKFACKINLMIHFFMNLLFDGRFEKISIKVEQYLILIMR